MPKNDVNKDLSMINDPDRWPRWPFLPIIRDRSYKPDDTGLLFDGEGKKTVYLCNLFMVPDDLRTIPKLEYDTAEALLADGWTVD